MLNLEGKTAVITGGGSGIGRAIAQKFARQNADVTIFELTEDHAADALKDIRDAGGQAQAYACDVSDPESVVNAVNKTIDQSKRIDILVNNAGIAHVGNAVDTSVEDFTTTRNWFMIDGAMVSSACGKTIDRNVMPDGMPSERAAQIWPRSTPSIPDRNVSAR